MKSVGAGSLLGTVAARNSLGLTPYKASNGVIDFDAFSAVLRAYSTSASNVSQYSSYYPTSRPFPSAEAWYAVVIPSATPHLASSVFQKTLVNFGSLSEINRDIQSR